jgi:hypothetical protein
MARHIICHAIVTNLCHDRLLLTVTDLSIIIFNRQRLTKIIFNRQRLTKITIGRTHSFSIYDF